MTVVNQLKFLILNQTILQRKMTMLKCDGCSSDKEPEGEVEPIIVIWNNKPLSFNYCQGCIKQDCIKGFEVYDTNGNFFKYIPEQLKKNKTMSSEDFILMQWMLNNWDSLMTTEQYEWWYMNELSKYESNKEEYEINY